MQIQTWYKMDSAYWRQWSCSCLATFQHACVTRKQFGGLLEWTVLLVCDVHIDIDMTLNLIQCLHVICGCRLTVQRDITGTAGYVAIVTIYSAQMFMFKGGLSWQKSFFFLGENECLDGMELAYKFYFFLRHKHPVIEISIFCIFETAISLLL